jgi:hypothetical protein
MNSSLRERLDEILPKVTGDRFLSSEGIGNEIACYLFDYPADAELEVREHIEWMMARFETHHSNLRVLHLNLLDVVLDYLRHRRLLDKALEMQTKKSDKDLLRALKGPLAAEKIRDFIASEHRLEEYDLVFMSGVGSVWPMLRAHSLLNCLHTAMGHTPLVMFYPGSFDGTTLRLFDRINASGDKPGAKQYYRAFILVPQKAQP